MSQIVLDPQFEPLLHGIDDFSHMVAPHWLSKITTYTPQRRPHGRDDVQRLSY